MTEKHTYRLDLSAFDLDVLEEALIGAVAERARSAHRTADVENQVRALNEIRRAIFAQEPLPRPRRSEISWLRGGAAPTVLFPHLLRATVGISKPRSK
jgi:hypothetical protein